jgi:hypothetical protein
MYELPDMDRKGSHLVTADVVRKERSLLDLPILRKPEKKIA